MSVFSLMSYQADAQLSSDLTCLPSPNLSLPPPPRRRRTMIVPINLSQIPSSHHNLPTPLPTQVDIKTDDTIDSFHSEYSIGRSSKATTPSSIDPPEISKCSNVEPEHFPPRSSSRHLYKCSSDATEKSKMLDSNFDTRFRPPTPPRRDSASSNTPMVFGTGTAKVARSISGAGIDRACIVRCSTPNAASLMSLTRVSPTSCESRPTSSTSMKLDSDDRQSCHLESNDTIHEAIWMAPARAERVDTRYSKDFSTLKNRRASAIRLKTEAPLSPFLMPHFPSRSSLQITSSAAQSISMSNIMTVVSTAPDHEQLLDKNLSVSKNEVICESLSSSDRESSESMASSTKNNGSEYDNHVSSKERSYLKSESESHDDLSEVDVKPRERQEQNKSLDHRDVETRLNKMEHENAVLLFALNNIVKKFGDLKLIEPDFLRDELKSTHTAIRIGKKPNWNTEESGKESTAGLSDSSVIFNKVHF